MTARAAADRALGALQTRLHAAGAPEGVVRLAGSVPRRGYEFLSPAGRDIRGTRRRLARRFLEGDGIEIGALNLPLALPPAARARYVDRKPIDGLRAEYPEWAAWDVTPPDIVDDGETLATIPDASVDFVVANHFLEHTEDPIRTLSAHLRTLRLGGTGFYAVPDKRFSFDVKRPVTPLEHIAADHREGPQRSRAEHYREWARDVLDLPEAEAVAEAERLDQANDSIHFHVWTPGAFAELLVHCRRAEGLPLEVEAIEPVRHEFIVILRKTG